MANKKCLNCGKIVKDWYWKCPYCHNDINKKAESPVATVKTCANCGKTVKGLHSHCPFCRAELSQKEQTTSFFACPHCREHVNAADTVCSHCGKEIGHDLIVVGVDEEEFLGGCSSDDSTPEYDEYASTPKQLLMEQQLDELVKRSRRIDDNLLTIKQYLKFFVILTVIFLAIYLISTFVSCHAACKAAEELESFYFFVPYI